MINQSYSLKCKVYKLLKGSVFKVSSNEGDPHKNLSGIVHCRDFIPHQVKISYNMQSQTIFLWRHFKKTAFKRDGKKDYKSSFTNYEWHLIYVLSYNVGKHTHQPA